MIVTVCICNRLVPTTNPFRMEKEKLKLSRQAGGTVKFRQRKDRNTQYGKRSPPPVNVDDHPDAAESRATSF